MKNFKFVLILISFSAFSQVRYGITGGLNLGDILQQVRFTSQNITENVTVVAGETSQQMNTTSSTTESFDQTVTIKTSPKVSFYVGGFAELPINKKGNLFLRTAFIYAQNGAIVDKITEKTDMFSGFLSPELTLNYSSQGGKYIVGQLNLPLLLKFETKQKIAFLGGCYFGAILSAKALNNGDVTNNIKQEMKPFDFGLELGVSYQIKKNIAFAFRYNHGLINLDSTSETTLFYQLKGYYYNRTIHFGLEYTFNKRKQHTR
jgi:hypothetical protein